MYFIRLLNLIALSIQDNTKSNNLMFFMLCVPFIILQCADKQRDAQILQIILIPPFFCSTFIERLARSSSGALSSILYHAAGTIR